MENKIIENYLLSKFNPDKDKYLIDNDIKKLKEEELNMYKNYNDRINQIKMFIMKNANLKKNQKIIKKYNIKNKYMFYELEKYIKQNNFKCIITYDENKDQLCKKLNCIYPSFISNCCTTCDNKIQFYKEKKPICFITITYLII